MDQTRSSESSDVRIGPSLNDAEVQYLKNRANTVLECLKLHNISCREAKVPKIAVLGSGGGLRAMIALLGSLSQLNKEKLLDSVMYLSGVSGSTWCMASLYKQPDWSTNLEDVKEDIVERLANGNVSIWERRKKLENYYVSKDTFSLTDVWAALAVPGMVKEIDDHHFTEQRGKHANDPYPIYTVIDKQRKYDRCNADVWFEMTPDECGYSLARAFVDSTYFESQFVNGKLSKRQPENDMLYLQGLCGSALADMEVNLKTLWEWLKQLIKRQMEESQKSQIGQMEESLKSLTEVHQNGCQVLLELVELHLCVLTEKDPSAHRKTLNGLIKDKCGETGQIREDVPLTQKELKVPTLDICGHFFDWFGIIWDVIWIAIVRTIEKIVHWDWGSTYNYLYNMAVQDVDPSILSSEKREYEDAGLFLNSPFFSVLRKERDINLIISLDFSTGDPFETVVKTAEICKDLKIPFPEVVVPHGDIEPEDFYVFRGSTKAPTVIHMPLFNCVNCKGEVEKWEDKYSTFKLRYNQSDIEALLDKAALNIQNNKEKLLTEIKNIIGIC